MYCKHCLIIAGAISLTFATVGFSQEKELLGFNTEQTAEQFKLEGRFDSRLQADHLRMWMKRLSAHPHHVGSPYGKENADFIASQFKAWGYDTEIEVYHVLFPTPVVRILEMTEPVSFKAVLVEPPLKEDATSNQQGEQLPVYNAYSIDGDVTGDLVYVNQGIPKDYEELDRRGIDVAGKIVIARYGGSWRGIKAKMAAEKGAIGCVLYSDPRDDGYFQGDVYPEGAFKGARGAQRGSVEDLPLYPGDPLTPGIGATKDAKRLNRNDAPSLTKIPVLPLSHSDALPLLKALGGPVAPAHWRGALPITYHIGPGPARVHLKLTFNWKIVLAYNVIARMPGNRLPEEWILRGNHHDAWVNGARDPVSGLVAMMEEARAIGELAKTGWRPLRTIVYAAWDAEEPGLIGSTEWVETHADLLRAKAAVYINTDSNGRGFLNAGGSHTLEKFFGQVARDVTDPQKGMSVAERKRAYNMLHGRPDDQDKDGSPPAFRLEALGSGSDYSPFLQHLGVASLNVGYGGEGRGGSYHSIYDSFDYYTRFIDPTFDYGIALAKTTGRAVLRLANAEYLPFEFQHFEKTVSVYVKEVMTLTDDMREETEKENRFIREGIYEAAADPTETFVVPEPKEPVPHLNFAPLENAAASLEVSGKKYEQSVQAFIESGETMGLHSIMELDRVLYQTERYLTRNEGLPRRPWYRHHLYAPGFYTGYGVKTLPGVREAIEQRNWKEAEEHIRIAGKLLEQFAGQIDRAAGIIGKATNQ